MANTRATFIIVFTVLVFSQARATGNLVEPQCGCLSDLRLMHTFMDEKFTMKDEIRQLKATVDELQSRLIYLETENKGSDIFIYFIIINFFLFLNMYLDAHVRLYQNLTRTVII